MRWKDTEGHPRKAHFVSLNHVHYYVEVNVIGFIQMILLIASTALSVLNICFFLWISNFEERLCTESCVCARVSDVAK